MPDIIELLGKWWKQMAAFIIMSMLVAGMVVFLRQRQYLSVATAIPTNSVSSDRSAIFNENIQGLYSSLGNSDDIDKFIGTAQLDTVYKSVTNDSRDLKSFSFEDTSKASKKLKANTRVFKSGYGELKVKVWHEDRMKAAEYANAVMSKLNSIHRAIQNERNSSVLANLITGRKQIISELDSLSAVNTYDSTNGMIRSAILNDEGIQIRAIRKNALLLQLSEYEKLINEYQLMVDNQYNALLVIEHARPAERPDRPRRMIILAATGVLSFIFSLFLALVLHKRKA